MNRKKIILLWGSVQTMLVVLLLMLMFTNTIGMMAFLISMIFVGIALPAVLVVILRKYTE